MRGFVFWKLKIESPAKFIFELIRSIYMCVIFAKCQVTPTEEREI